MNSSEKSTTAFIILWIARIVIFVKSGKFAWSWIDPESFWGAIRFIVAWGIIFFIAELIISAIIAIMFND